MIVSIDTNILAYFAGLIRSADDVPKEKLSRALIVTLSERVELVVATQAIAELNYLLLRHDRSRETIAAYIEKIRAFAVFTALDAPDFDQALDLSLRHHLQIFDAMILSASAAANARCLLTADMHDGWVWRGVEIINPMGKPVEATLERLGLSS